MGDSSFGDVPDAVNQAMEILDARVDIPEPSFFLIAMPPEDDGDCVVMRCPIGVEGGERPPAEKVAFGGTLETMRALLPEGLQMVQSSRRIEGELYVEVWA